jgi:phosphate transport system substrate-binding protein
LNIKHLAKCSGLMTALLLTVALALTGCAGGGNGGQVTTITMAGSTTVQPLAEELANNFTATRSDVQITVSGGGSSVGIQSAADGTVNIGMASRDLKPEEETLGLVVHIIARDGIAIISHPSQNVTNLSKNQTKLIFAGTITNWAGVGGDDATINVYAREEGSGTRAAFEEMVMKGTNITATALLFPSNGALRTAVAGDPNGIGFISFGYLDDSVKAFAIDGVEATVENAKNETYPIVRPLLLLTKGAPTGKVQEFINFCLGPVGQAIVAEHYIPVI